MMEMLRIKVRFECPDHAPIGQVSQYGKDGRCQA